MGRDVKKIASRPGVAVGPSSTLCFVVAFNI
jgi:hypothetical protein